MRRAVVGALLKLRFLLFHRHRHGHLVVEHLDGVPLVVLPRVFNPVLFGTGAMLARVVAREYGSRADGARCTPSDGRDADTQPRALDLGTGSGSSAIFAARAGFAVVAVDVNPDAVRCARLNARLNRVEQFVDAREGDLFSSVPGERFDLITFNPPFFRGSPEPGFDQAWRSESVIDRFAAELRDHLTPEGRVLLLLSSRGEGDRLLDLLRDARFEVEVAERKDFGSEMITVWSVRAGHPPADERLPRSAQAGRSAR